MEPLAVVAVFNPLVKEATERVEEGQERSIFNLEIFVELLEVEKANMEMNNEEKEKEKEDFVEAKKSTLAALVCPIFPNLTM